jgi:hypothetical protein
MPIQELTKRSGLSRRAVFMLRAGRRPSPKNRKILWDIANGPDDNIR